MNIPPFLIGAALLFWGAETDRLLIGLILMVLLEGHLVISARYDLDEEDFIKISDLTSLVFVGAIALILLNSEPLDFLKITTGWMPVILLPLIVAQLYSTGDTVTIGTRLGRKQKKYAHNPFDFRLYYIFVCIFAAATGNSGSVLFYLGTAAIFLLLFYVNRGRAFSLQSFGCVAFLLLVFSYGAGESIERSHRYIVDQSIRFLHNYYRDRYSDPFKTNVNFGETGRLKNSGEIIMRVEASPLSQLLLKNVSYDRYLDGSWFSDKQHYTFLLPVDEENWNLLEQPHKDGESIRVEYSLPKEKGLLPVPHGSFRLKSTTIYGLEQHDNGNLRVRDGAPVIGYDVRYDQNIGKKTDIPDSKHLDLPEKEVYALDQVALQLGLVGKSEGEKVEAIAAYFRQGFSYSLALLGSGNYSTPLGNFLLHKKTGFCEYYATASALLLRRVGLPSRYVTGYAVSEKSAFEEKYIVRKRHAHAWAEAYVNKSWVVVDNTPPDWFGADQEGALFFEPLQDMFNLLRHKYALYRIGTGVDYTLYYSILVVILTAFLVVRIYRRMRIEQTDGQPVEQHITAFERIITPLTPIIDHLEGGGHSRDVGESYSEWAQRVCDWPVFDAREFEELYTLHLKLRFDPEGLTEDAQRQLWEGAERYARYFEALSETQDDGQQT